MSPQHPKPTPGKLNPPKGGSGVRTPRFMMRSEVRVDTYAVISRAVEEGVAMGWASAHKHIDAGKGETVDPGAAKEAIENEVMNALSEVLLFAQPPEPPA